MSLDFSLCRWRRLRCARPAVEGILGPRRVVAFPNPDTPSLMIGVFSAPGKELAVELGDETRSRFQGEHSAKDLVHRHEGEHRERIEGLRISLSDSALSTQDMMELARLVHGDRVVAAG